MAIVYTAIAPLDGPPSAGSSDEGAARGPASRLELGRRAGSYVKHHFFVRYRDFERWAHLNQVVEQWLREEPDERRQATVQDIVRERFGQAQALTRWRNP